MSGERPPLPEGVDRCSQCGSTDYEDLYLGDQGYSACCNEPVVSTWRDKRG